MKKGNYKENEDISLEQIIILDVSELNEGGEEIARELSIVELEAIV